MKKAKRKRCKECKELFKATYSTAQMVCSSKCAYAYSKRKDKETKEKNKMVLEKLEIDKKSRTSLGALKKQTQLLFNIYIRLRDKGLPCISSNIPYKSDFDAGHCFPVGSYEGLRYDYDNVHGQSIGDNRFNEGNHVDYLINLPKRIGVERFKALVKRAEDYKKYGKKFTRSELIDIQSEVREKITELKKANVFS